MRSSNKVSQRGSSTDFKSNRSTAVARAASRTGLGAADLEGVRKWFAAYAEWMNTHPYGIAERDAVNNHGT